MRKYLACLFVATLPLQGAISVLNCGSNDDGGSSGSGAITATVNVSGGSGNIVVIGANASSSCSTVTLTISNGQGDTITPVGSQFTSLGGVCTVITYIQNPTGGASATYSVTPNFTTVNRTIVACEVSGIATSASLDQGPAGNESVTATNLVSGSVSTVSANEILLSYTGLASFGSTLVAGGSSICAGGCTIPPGALDANHFGAMEYIIASSTQSGTMNFTRGSVTTADTGVATFKAAGGGGSSFVANPTIITVGP